MSRMTPITSAQLAAAQKIIDFVQSLGWGVEGISIYRYDEVPGLTPFEQPDAWHKHMVKWGLELKIAPQDDDDVKKRHPQPA